MGAKTLLVAFASLVGVVTVGVVATAQQDGGRSAADRAARSITEPALIAAPVPTPAEPAADSLDTGDPTPAPDATPANPSRAGIEPVADTSSEATTSGELWVTYRSEVGGSLTAVVLAEGGTVVSSAILESAVAHPFELPAGTYLVDVVQTSGLVTQGDVATSSSSTVRSSPVVVTAGDRVDLGCEFSGCEVR